MKTRRRLAAPIIVLALALVSPGAVAVGASPYLEVQPSTLKHAVTTTGYDWMPELFGGPENHYAVFRLGPLAPGASYAVNLRPEGETEGGYLTNWVDGDPAGPEFRSLAEPARGAGEGAQEFLFTVDGASTSSFLFLVVRSSRAWPLSVEVTARPPALVKEAKERRGYLYLSDYAAEGGAPLLLSRSAGVLPASRPDSTAYVDVAPNTAKRLVTASGFSSMPSYFGGPEGYYALVRLAPLARGRRYELTLTYEAGTAMGYSSAWVDGDPLGWDFWPFVSINSHTGTRPIRNKQQKFLFTVDPKSTATTLHLLLRSNTRWTVFVGLTDRPYAVLSRDSRDAWGELYVTDLDADGNAPFLLSRGRR